MKFHRLGVIGQQPIRQQSFFEAGEVLHRFGCLDRAECAGDRAEDAGLLTVQYFLGRWRRVKETTVTSPLAGQHRHRLALQTDDAGVGEGNAQSNCHVVDQKLRVEIIAAVDDEIVTGGDVSGIVLVETRRIGLDLHIRIQTIQLCPGPIRLCAGRCLRRRVQDLPLQIGQLDFIRIDDAESPDAGGG